MLKEQNGSVVRFGVFEADLETGELRRSGRRVKLQDQPFRILGVLLERPGELVSRDELKRRIWPEDTLIDFDHALTTAVKKLRRVLRDSAATPRYVETLPKRGYRFIAPAEILSWPATPVVRGARSEAMRLRRQRNLLAVIATGLIAALGFLIVGREWRQAGPVPSRPGRHFIFTAPAAPAAARSTAISPDGCYIVLAATSDTRMLWLRNLAEQETIPMPGTEGAASPFWSPDSEFVGFGAGAMLKVVSVHGGAPREVCPLPGGNFFGGAWSPDGEWIAFSTGTPPGLCRVPAGGGIPERLFESVAAPGGSANYDVAFLPSDVRPDTILFMAGGPAHRELYARDLRTGKLVRLGQGVRPVYSRLGYVIFQAPEPASGLWALPFDGGKLEPTGAAFPIAEEVIEPSLAEDDTLVFIDLDTRIRSQQLEIVDRSGESIALVVQPQDSVGGPVLSPDESKFAVAARQADQIDIWIYELETGMKSRATFDTAVVGDPVWSPDGTTIVYRSDRTADTELVALDLSRRAEPLVLPAAGLAKRPTDWSGDGRFLVYSASAPQTQSDLRVLEFSAEREAVGSRVLIQTPANEVDGQISPDGRWLAYCSDEAGRYEVYVTPFPEGGPRWQVSTEGACQTQWSRGGAELLYVSGGRLMAVPVMTEENREFLTGSPEPLLERRPARNDGSRALLPGPGFRASYAVTGDGERIVLRISHRTAREKPVSVHVVENWREVLSTQ